MKTMGSKNLHVMHICHLLQVLPPNGLLTHFSEWRIPYELAQQGSLFCVLQQCFHSGLTGQQILKIKWRDSELLGTLSMQMSLNFFCTLLPKMLRHFQEIPMGSTHSQSIKNLNLSLKTQVPAQFMGILVNSVLDLQLPTSQWILISACVHWFPRDLFVGMVTIGETISAVQHSNTRDWGHNCGHGELPERI